MDFKNDEKYVSRERKFYCYKNYFKELINEIYIINPNFEEKFFEKSQNYNLKVKEISNIIDKFVDSLKNDKDKYTFYELLEIRKALCMFEYIQSYINGYKKGIELMVEVYGSEYKVDFIEYEDIGAVEDDE